MQPDDLFGVYVHWPFCKAKCPYCDFNSHVSNSIDHELWAQSYLKEIDYIADMTKGRQVTSVFFGGGTPSLMKPATVEKILNHINKVWRVSPKVEITLEANPTSIEAQKFSDFKAAGVNRVSVGVQSLRDQDLKFLGREHSAQEALEAIKIADCIFDRMSFDLIYARPEQKISDWKEELSEALQYTKGHLSLYQLTIEQGTPFYTMAARGEFRIPEQDQAGEFYEVTQEILDASDMPAYEISNHASKGQESLHNLTYWKYGDYAGIGPGAHGRLTLDQKKFATRTHRAPDIWLKKINEDGNGYHPFEEVASEERLTEMMMMGLRLNTGVELAQIERETQQDWRMALRQDKVQNLVDEGLLILTKTHIKPTSEGMQRLNGVLSYLLV
ncbi:MAG TPA: radical SAM family heme chaperone HemW [Alphaproteobacteria bacterium]|nr:radical SAM family heme chaperone HemW [Alphaproteobacteria bacterium]